MRAKKERGDLVDDVLRGFVSQTVRADARVQLGEL
jgi:hypothetical protein